MSRSDAWERTQMEPDVLSGAELAYLGDAVIELLTREYLLNSGVRKAKELNNSAMKFVTARAQSEAIQKILPRLSEEEIAVFKRGRNGHSSGTPKSAGACEYRRATGFEALFAYLWLKKRQDRVRELFAAAYSLDGRHFPLP